MTIVPIDPETPPPIAVRVGDDLGASTPVADRSAQSDDCHPGGCPAEVAPAASAVPAQVTLENIDFILGSIPAVPATNFFVLHSSPTQHHPSNRRRKRSRTVEEAAAESGDVLSYLNDPDAGWNNVCVLSPTSSPRDELAAAAIVSVFIQGGGGGDGGGGDGENRRVRCVGGKGEFEREATLPRHDCTQRALPVHVVEA